MPRVTPDSMDPAARAIYDVAHQRAQQLDLKELLIELQVVIHVAFHQHAQLTVRCIAAAVDGCFGEMETFEEAMRRDDEEEDQAARLN